MSSHAKARTAGPTTRPASRARKHRNLIPLRGARGDAFVATGLGRNRIGLACLAGLIFLLGSGSPAPAAPVPGDPCPNGDVRAQQGVAYLPDCLALEQVSPSSKANASVRFPTISSDGLRVRFSSFGAFADPPSITSLLNEFVATRGSVGWATKSAGPPKQFIMGSRGDAQPFAFAPSLSRWAFAGMTPSQNGTGVGQVFLNGLDGILESISPLMRPLSGGSVTLDFQGASRDLSLIAFAPNQPRTGGIDRITSYLPGDPRPAPNSSAFANTYLATVDGVGSPSLRLLARDADGKAWGGNCGAAVGGVRVNSRPTVGAVSVHPSGGSRIWISTRPTQPATGNCNANNKLRILERTEMPAGPQITEPIISECARVAPAPACVTTPAVDDYFEAASLDGTKVFFRTARQMTDTDTDAPGSCTIGEDTAFISPGCDLYLYDSTAPVGERLTQVSAGDDPESPNYGNGADVLGVTAVSGDGSHIYFVAKGALTSGAGPKGTTALAGQPNLYLYQRDDDHPQGRIAFIGVLDSSPCTSVDPANVDCAMLWGALTGRPAQALPILGGDPSETEVGGDGHRLVFVSRAPLTADDEDGSAADIFRYDAEAHELVRISKASPSCSIALCGAAPGNDPTYGVGRNFGDGRAAGPDYALGEYSGRLASEEGETIAFTTQEQLVPDDDDGLANVYVWREGELVKLPGAIALGNSQNPTLNNGRASTVSQDGSQVAYTTFTPVLTEDGDTARDVYVARVNGGFLYQPPPVGCDPDEPGEKGCLPPPTGSPTDQGAGTSSFLGRGNLTESSPKPRFCRKGSVRRGNRCVAKRKLAQRACAERKGRAKRRCVSNQVRRLNRAANAYRRASK